MSFRQLLRAARIRASGSAYLLAAWGLTAVPRSVSIHSLLRSLNKSCLWWPSSSDQKRTRVSSPRTATWQIMIELPTPPVRDRRRPSAFRSQVPKRSISCDLDTILFAVPGDFLGYQTWGILLQDHCLLDAGLAARALGSNPSRAALFLLDVVSVYHT